MHNTAANELAYRTSLTAGSFVGSLAADLHQISYALKMGDIAAGLESFDAQADRLQRFLTYLVVSSELMFQARDPVGAVLGDYARRLIAMITRVEDALNQRDLVGLAVALEHGLARGISEYANYEADVQRSLGMAAAA